MGNSLGGKRRAKVMRIDGSTMKVKPPAVASDVLRDNPGFVLLESEQVKLLGLKAKPLDADQPLKPRKLYFLVELPKLPPRPAPALSNRRVRSGINMSAKDRLESLMLSRRTASDMTFARVPAVPGGREGEGEGGTPQRVRLRLPRGQVARLVEESRDPAEAAEKIVELCAATEAGGGRRAAPTAAAELMPAARKAVSGPLEGKEKRMRFATTAEIIG